MRTSWVFAHVKPHMWRFFYYVNFSLHCNWIKEIFEQQISHASMTEIQLQVLLCFIQYNESLDSCGRLVMPHPREWFCVMIVWLLVWRYFCVYTYIALADWLVGPKSGGAKTCF